MQSVLFHIAADRPKKVIAINPESVASVEHEGSINAVITMNSGVRYMVKGDFDSTVAKLEGRSQVFYNLNEVPDEASCKRLVGPAGSIIMAINRPGNLRMPEIGEWIIFDKDQGVERAHRASSEDTNKVHKIAQLVRVSITPHYEILAY